MVMGVMGKRVNTSYTLQKQISLKPQKSFWRFGNLSLSCPLDLKVTMISQFAYIQKK